MNNDLEEIIYKPPNYGSVIKKLQLESNEKKTTAPFLYFASFILFLSSVTNGMITGWVSPTTAKLLSTDPKINPFEKPVTVFQLSLIGALSSVGFVIGPLLLGRFHDIFGRRNALIMISVATIICITTLALATHINIYYLELISIGICMSGSIVGMIIYASEITESHNRARVICFIVIGMPLGSLFTYLLGHFFSVKHHTFLCVAPLVIFLVCFVVFLPESSVYSISKGKREDAIEALTKLRKKSLGAIEKEADEIETNMGRSSALEQESMLVILRRKAARRGLLLMCGLNLITMMCGMPVIIAYLELIFHDANTGISAYLCAIVAGVVQVLCCLCASFLIERWGRRPLLLISSISTVLSLFLLGLFFYFKHNDFLLIQYIQWMPIPIIILFLVGYSIGFTLVPVAMLNEIPLVMFSSGIEEAAVVFCFPIMTKTIGYAFSFWMFCIPSVLGLIFIYYKIPETKGKSLREIQDMLSK